MKISYEILSLELEKLYSASMSIPCNDIAKIDEHCQFISDFIEACGWTEEEYISEMFGFGKGN